MSKHSKYYVFLILLSSILNMLNSSTISAMETNKIPFLKNIIEFSAEGFKHTTYKKPDILFFRSEKDSNSHKSIVYQGSKKFIQEKKDKQDLEDIARKNFIYCPRFTESEDDAIILGIDKSSFLTASFICLRLSDAYHNQRPQAYYDQKDSK